jgi:hypothetical protein
MTPVYRCYGGGDHFDSNNASCGGAGTDYLLGYAPALPPVSVSSPTISGRAGSGQTLTANPGAWTGTEPLSYAYQWLRCDRSGTLNSCTSIAGATSRSYTVTMNDALTTLRVRVTASNVVGAASATSAPTDLVTPV